MSTKQVSCLWCGAATINNNGFCSHNCEIQTQIHLCPVCEENPIVENNTCSSPECIECWNLVWDTQITMCL